MKKIIIAVLISICFHTISVAQNNKGSLSKKQFDELWNKADSTSKLIIKTGNSTKDLNATERNNIKAVDIKEKTVTNKNFKPIDTSNMEQLSTQPIVKGTGKTTKAKDAVIDLSLKDNAKIESIKKEPTIVKDQPMVKSTTPVTPKNTMKDVDFSTQPIVKGKQIPAVNTTATYAKPSKKTSMDTTKGFREFTFETSPIVSGSASYNRRNEPMPKSKEEIEDAIPVNRKPNNTNVGKDKSFMTEAYAQYDKEADSLHTANKRVLDSIMKSLKIKVPIIINPNDFIDIYVNGGGTLINNDSKMYDRISILHTGVVQREYKTKNDDVQRAQKKISKDELAKLAQYMVDMGFFNFNKEYDCADEDAECNQRFSKSPQVVPLEVSLTVGAQKNKIKVAIYAPKTEKNTVHYPASLEKIMNAIYTIVEK